MNTTGYCLMNEALSFGGLPLDVY